MLDDGKAGRNYLLKSTNSIANYCKPISKSCLYSFFVIQIFESPRRNPYPNNNRSYLLTIWV